MLNTHLYMTCCMLCWSVHYMLYPSLMHTIHVAFFAEALHAVYFRDLYIICCMFHRSVRFNGLFVPYGMLHWFVHSILYASLVCTFHTVCFTGLFISYCMFHWSVHYMLYVSLICSWHAVCFTDLFITCCLLHLYIYFICMLHWSVPYMDLCLTELYMLFASLLCLPPVYDRAVSLPAHSPR